MKRELAFALEARSQFSCFIGRTRSSKSPPPQFDKRKSKEQSSSDRSKISIDEVNMSRRSKRVKTEIPDADLMNVDRSKSPETEVAKGEEKSAAADVAMGAEESAAPEVVMGEGESTAPEVAKGEEEPAAVPVKSDEKVTRTVEKVYVKRKSRKDSSTPKRFTRSALKSEHVEELGTPSRKNLELKMSKKIGLGRMPTKMRELLETGLLEGFRVFYNLEGRNLKGVIKGAGILCSCNLCMGTKVISPSQFELHACDSYRNAIKHICLENGKSLVEILEICRASAMEPPEVALQTLISSLPVKGTSTCTDCNNPIEASSSENMLICDSCLNKKQVEPIPEPEPEPKQPEPEQEPEVATIEDVRASSPVPQPDTSTSMPVVLEKKRGPGRPRKSDSILRSPKSASNKIKAKDKILKRFRSPRSTTSAPKSTTFAPKSTPQQKSGKKLTIKNQQLHWAVFEKGGLPDGTELTYISHGKKLLDGYKLGHGICCSCCQTEISASQFEAHAGWASRKKPYENIYISNGVSLHEYAVTLNYSENRKFPVKFNDDLCRVCWDGGNLLLCDGCPRSFHKECIDETDIPNGKWYCRYCKQALKFDPDCENATVAGRVEGIDLIEQITKRCIRIVKPPENIDLVACILCRGHDFSKGVFNDRTVIVCDQCEREYHIGCLREHKMADLEALPKGKWFCKVDCERIHSVLQDLLTREPEIVHEDLLTFVRKKEKEKKENEKVNENENEKVNENENEEGKEKENEKDKEKEKEKEEGQESNCSSEMKFVLLCGKNATRETKPFLTQTIDIFHEGFDPIIDATSGRDFIPSMVYGRKIWSQDFAGMLCAILTIESNVVSAGTLRVFGQDIAELPIVATSKCNQGKGYFHVLFSCIERLLSSMNIKKIVLPAADEAKSIWTKLGFQTIEPEELGDLRKRCSAMMTFKGTSMLQKDIPQPENGGNGEDISGKNGEESQVQVVGDGDTEVIGDGDIEAIGGE